jgi:hypothetical protein
MSLALVGLPPVALCLLLVAFTLLLGANQWVKIIVHGGHLETASSPYRYVL